MRYLETAIPGAVCEICRIARIAEIVQTAQLNIPVPGEHIADKVAADESGAAGDEQFHKIPS